MGLGGVEEGSGGGGDAKNFLRVTVAEWDHFSIIAAIPNIFLSSLFLVCPFMSYNENSLFIFCVKC